MDGTTKEIIKFVLVIGALPWVIPFARLLIRDLLLAFEEDGGLLGPPPSPQKLKEIRKAKRSRPDPLVNEPLAHVQRAGARAGGTNADGRG